MINNLPPSSLNPFPFAFRRGGSEGRWGLWFSLGGTDLLVNPDVLPELVCSSGDFPRAFIPQCVDDYLTVELPFEKLSIRDLPWMAPSYMWKLCGHDGSSLLLPFDRETYLRAILGGIRDLYRFCVTERRGDGHSAYLSPDREDSLLGGILVETIRGICFVTEQLGADPGEWGLDLSLPVEPFCALLDEASHLHVSIAERGWTAAMWTDAPEGFRHDLEHLVYHEETSLSLDDECGSSEFSPTLQLRRVLIPGQQDGDPVLLVGQKDGPGPFAGFCYEREVIQALAEVFRLRFPDSPLGEPLTRRLEHYRD